MIFIPVAKPRFGFPKSARILRRSDFRKVYDQGSRYACPYFAAFSLCTGDSEGSPRVGFTVSRPMGNAIIRNRMKRRMREAVRLHLDLLSASFMIVFNPRKPLLEADANSIEREVVRYFRKCVNS